jgi:hypothetical protein
MSHIAPTLLAAAGLLCSLLHSLPAAQADPVVIGGFDSTRIGDVNLITGFPAEQIRAALTANVPGHVLVAASTLTPAFLSGVDLLIITNASGISSSTVLLPAEQTALLDFVKSGKSAFILADGFAFSALSFVTPFGMFGEGRTTTIDVGPVTDLNHPIANGPFGQATTFTTYYAGWFTDLGPAAPIAVLGANGLASYAAIDRDAISPGSGRVVLTTDASAFADANDGGFFLANEALFNNSVDWLLAVPEPSTWILAFCGAISLGLLGRMRRQRDERSGL